MTDTATLTQRIHSVYADLPTGERKAASVILDGPGELAVWSASELAERSDVSPATISRLVRRLGYENYDEARRDARAMRAGGSPLYLADSGDGKTNGHSLLSKTLTMEARLIEDSLALVNPLVIASLATHLAKAPRIRLAGFRNSHVVADFARTMFGQFRGDVEMLNAPGQTLAEGIAGIGTDDAVLIVGLRRRPSGFTDFVRAVAGSGADVAMLADSSIREAPAEARWNITCRVETPQLLDSYTGVLAVLRLLAMETMRRLDGDARKHLAKIEDIHIALDELD